jgi:hypothetical protein
MTTSALIREAVCLARVPPATRGRDLVIASLDTLVAVIGEAVRLGHDDARSGHAQRTGSAIADVLRLARWNGLQQLQLRHAYTAGRELVEFQAFNLAAPHSQAPATCVTGAATATDAANTGDAPGPVIKPRAG